MSRGIIEIPIEVWEGCQRDAERIAFLHEQVAALAAENERLRKAGDALQQGWIKDIRQTAAGRMTIKTIEDCCPAIAAWNAAKEGGDAK